MLIRVVVIVGLFVIAGFCIVMGKRSRPHNLEKEAVTMTFNKNLPHELYEPLAVLNSTKGELVGTAIWAAVFAGIIVMLFNGQGNALYLIPCGFGILYTLWLSTRKLLIYENALVLKTLTGSKVYYLDEIDCIVSYNIVNSFNRGISYGYRLHRNGEVILSLPKGSFKEIDIIEKVYQQNPYLKEYVVF